MNSVNRLTLEELTALRDAYKSVLHNGACILSGAQVGVEFEPRALSCVNLHHALCHKNPELEYFSWRLDAAVALLLHWYCGATGIQPYLTNTSGHAKRNLYPMGRSADPVNIWGNGSRMLYLAWAIGKIEQRITELENTNGDNQSN